MHSGYAGSDVVVCHSEGVTRHWVTDHIKPTDGVLVPDATCTTENGVTRMKFKRLAAAQSATQREISLTGDTTFIMAHGTSKVHATCTHVLTQYPAH